MDRTLSISLRLRALLFVVALLAVGASGAFVHAKDSSEVSDSYPRATNCYNRAGTSFSLPDTIAAAHDAVTELEPACAPGASCRFSSLRADLRRRGNKSCEDIRRSAQALRSPFREMLNIEDRMSAIVQLGKNSATAFGVDPRAMLCIAAHETLGFEPLTINDSVCRESRGGAQGLGQLLFSTLRGLMVTGVFMTSAKADAYARCGFPLVITRTGASAMVKFRSSIPAYSAISDPQELYVRMGESPRLQLEISNFLLSANYTTTANWTKAYASYGTGEPYGTHIQSCVDCMKKCISNSGANIARDTRAKAHCFQSFSAGILKNFDLFKQQIEKIQTSRQSGPAEPRAHRLEPSQERRARRAR